MVHRDQLANRDEFVTLRQQAIQRGGGHVVLPLLQAEVVPRGWLDNNTFLAGYGIAQALPGPLSIEPHRHNRL